MCVPGILKLVPRFLGGFSKLDAKKTPTGRLKIEGHTKYIKIPITSNPNKIVKCSATYVSVVKDEIQNACLPILKKHLGWTKRGKTPLKMKNAKIRAERRSGLTVVS